MKNTIDVVSMFILRSNLITSLTRIINIELFKPLYFYKFQIVFISVDLFHFFQFRKKLISVN